MSELYFLSDFIEKLENVLYLDKELDPDSWDERIPQFSKHLYEVITDLIRDETNAFLKEVHSKATVKDLYAEDFFVDTTFNKGT